MGKNTFNIVCSFGIEWPYEKPVFMLSNSIKEIPKGLEGKVELLSGAVEDVLELVHSRGYKNLYIDGGVNIQNFLEKDLIDEMIITVIPKLIGGGKPLFSNLAHRLDFECISSSVDRGVVQNHFRRVK